MEGRPTGSIPDASELLASASVLCGGPVDIVAVDMPLSRLPIEGRRASDNAVSAAYGGRWASTHTPSISRPGPVSDNLRAGFEAMGYPLQTEPDASQGLIEVYPHPAIIEFAMADKRSPYKYGNRSKYWPDLSATGRRTNILSEWANIVSLMENEIEGVASALPPLEGGTANGVDWKAYEDMLDAIVCVAVGICVLENRALPFGDKDSAIWIPKPGCAKPIRLRSEP